ncbi:MAG TPA: BlaI/MecI/CopY family transcriptional regulator [Mucilaginibacter sp.]|nr:BlaI/MecI/CopY family transcriptional regulator [Mucilaginibacter sp.]
MKLSKAEEELMQYLWKLEKAFMKDIVDCYPDPKPAATTTATLLKRMADKGVISYRLFGNSREYYPLITKSAYFSNHFNGLIKNFFNNSTSQFASFFTQEADMTTAELEELKKIIDKEIQKKKK